MPKSRFKFRAPFDFSPHRYEIGNPVIQNRSLEDNFYLLKVYKLAEEDFGAYYLFHLNYFSESHPNGEEQFFDHVLDIVTTRINHFKRQNPISPKYAQNMANVRKLEAFLAFLKTIDRWHKLEPIESVVAEKDREIDKLTDRIIELEAMLKEATRHDTSEKINITKGNIAAFMDIVKQLQDLTTPENGSKFLIATADTFLLASINFRLAS